MNTNPRAFAGGECAHILQDERRGRDVANALPRIAFETLLQERDDRRRYLWGEERPVGIKGQDLSPGVGQR